jgi:hypothetical protein
MTRAYAQTGPALSAKIKAELENKTWPIYVISQNMVLGKIKSSVETDVLTFADDSVVSEGLSSQGYSKGGSVYRAKMAPSGSYVWESIQLHENQADTVLIKGELKDGVMKGVMVYQTQDMSNRTVNFTTVKPK